MKNNYPPPQVALKTFYKYVFSVYLATVSLHSWLQSGEHSRDSSFRRKLQSILGSKENNIFVENRIKSLSM